MRKQTPKLEWQVIENDAEWERQQILLAPTMTPLTGYRLYVQTYAGNLTVLLLLLVMGGVWWYSYQSDKVQGEVAAAATAPAAQYAASADPVAAIGGVNSNQNRSARQLLTQGNTAGPSEQSLATPYFLYHFRPQDEATVRAVAPSMDALYTNLWHNLGLPIRPMPNKLVIEVAPDQLPGLATLVFASVRAPSPAHYLMPGDPPTEPSVISSVTVPSPARYLAPVDLSDADLLAQSIALPLITHGLAQARQLYRIGSAWQPLMDGLYLWQVWDTDLPLSDWRKTVVQWQYSELPTARAEQALPLPQHYQELCTAHKLWLHSPTQIYISLECSGVEREEGRWHMWRTSAPLITLAQLAVPSPKSWGGGASWLVGPPFYTNHPGQTVVLATLVEYAVHTYGRESLPGLLAALGDADRWETLIPVVFGVSATAFEADWQSYLAGQYGVPLDALR